MPSVMTAATNVQTGKYEKYKIEIHSCIHLFVRCDRASDQRLTHGPDKLSWMIQFPFAEQEGDTIRGMVFRKERRLEATHRHGHRHSFAKLHPFFVILVVTVAHCNKGFCTQCWLLFDIFSRWYLFFLVLLVIVNRTPVGP